MTVRIKLFAAAKELVGSDTVSVEVANGATIADVRDALMAKIPALTNIMTHSLWAIDAEYASPGMPITENNAIALIPPVSGG